MPRTNEYYVVETAKWVKEHVPWKMGSVFHFYVDCVEAPDILSCSLNAGFCNMAVSMYDSDIKYYRGHIFTVSITFRRYE